MAVATIYVDRKDAVLTAEGRTLVVHYGGVRAATLPFGIAERIVIRSRVSLDSRLLGTLAEEGITVVLINPRDPSRTVLITGGSSNDVRRELGQHLCYFSTPLRTLYAKRLVVAKLAAQIQALEVIERERPDQRKPLFDARAVIEHARTSAVELEITTEAIASLRGHEGSAAAAYFRALTSVFPESVGFQGRNRRPPRDPVNACLSLGYTILHYEAEAACYAAGLQPRLGLFHEPAFGRSSLAADFIEPLRPRMDRFVWNLFRKRTLDTHHFTLDKGACLLGKGGREIFYEQWESAARSWRRWLRHECYRLAREFEAQVRDAELLSPTEEIDSLE